jgi:hypothetical protein
MVRLLPGLNGNWLLASMTAGDRARLKPMLELVDLPFGSG